MSGAQLARPVAVVDLLDRVLATGVVVTGEVTLSLAGIDLVYVSLRALLTSVRPGLVPQEVLDPDTDEIGAVLEGKVVEDDTGPEPVP